MSYPSIHLSPRPSGSQGVVFPSLSLSLPTHPPLLREPGAARGGAHLRCSR